MTLPLDAHAHVEPGILSTDLAALNACVVAVTRSLDEFDLVLRRNDPRTVWGVGCHPGLVRSLRGFDSGRFMSAIDATPIVGEIGLDGSRGQRELQAVVFNSILGCLKSAPRILSIHSYKATTETLDAIDAHRPTSAVLHWWLGSPAETARAVSLGAYFSLNASQVRNWSGRGLVPIDRVLLETDHPFGDRGEGASRRPGYLARTEQDFARALGIAATELRSQVWRNFYDLASQANVFELFPRAFQTQMIAA